MKYQIVSAKQGEKLDVLPLLKFPEDFHGSMQVDHLVKFGDSFVSLIGKSEAEVFEARVAEMKKNHPEVYICGRAFDENDTPDTLIVRPNGEIRMNWLLDNPLVGNVFVDSLTEVIANVEKDFAQFSATNTYEYRVCYERGVN